MRFLGRPRKPTIVPDKNLKYSQVIKNKKGRKLQKIEKRVIFGKSVDQSEISASLLERQNLTFRQDKNRISRKTIGFSKKIKGLYSQMGLYFTHFNFCRHPMGLTKEIKMESPKKKAPAKEAGITKSRWTLTKLLNFKFIKIPTNLGVTHFKCKIKHMRTYRENYALDSLVFYATCFLSNCVSPIINKRAPIFEIM